MFIVTTSDVLDTATTIDDLRRYAALTKAMLDFDQPPDMIAAAWRRALERVGVSDDEFGVLPFLASQTGV